MVTWAYPGRLRISKFDPWWIVEDAMTRGMFIHEPFETWDDAMHWAHEFLILRAPIYPGRMASA